MRKRILISFLCLVAQVALATYGQEASDAGYRVSEEKWLPNRKINCLFQDSEGLLWVGTGSGLYRYDGFQVKHFATHPQKNNTIFTNYVTDLAEDAAGNLVVATESGLSLFTKSDESFRALSKDIERFNRLQTTPGGIVWVGASGAHMYRLPVAQAGQKSKQTLQVGVDDYFAFAQKVGEVHDFISLRSADLLLGTSKGLFRFNPVTQELTSLHFEYDVDVLKLLKNGRLLVGTRDSGLFEVTLDDNVTIIRQFHLGKKSGAGHDRITSISEGPLGQVLVSTRQMYYLADTKAEQLVFETPVIDTELLEDNNIETTYIDRMGVIWIGTLRGLLKVRPAPVLAERIKIQAPGYLPLNQHINYLYKENETRYWLKTRDDGVFVFNPVEKKFLKVALPGGIGRFARSQKGYYLAFGRDKVYRFESFDPKPALTEVLTSSQNISCGLEISPGEWWFGCGHNGLLAYSDSGEGVYDDLLKKINAQFHQTSTIFVLMRDSEQNIWIGSRGDGLMKVNIRTGELKKYSGMGRAGSISRRILHIKEDSRGRIWVATREGGLYRYNSTSDDFQQFTTAQGLPSNVICAVSEDNVRRIIVSTDNGVAVYQEGDPVSFRPYDQRDGIAFTDFSFNSVAEAKNGDVYFGNSNGLYRFRLTEPPASGTAGFRWASFHIIRNDGSRQQLIDRDEYLLSYDPQRGISLDSDENSFELTFSLLNYTDPTKNRYAYRLKGHNDEWKYILDGNPQVYFHDLRGGAYTLEVKAADSYGRWGDTIHSLTLHVAPPFWRSPGAYLLYVLLIILAAYIVYRLLRRVDTLQKQLEQEVALVALQDQRMIYFSDLSHEIKNRLSLILGPLEKALSGKKVNQAVLNNLYEHTLRLKRISDQIMNLRKSEAGEFLLEVSQGTLFQALERLCQEAEPLAIVRDIRLHYTFGPEHETTWFDEELIEIILLNLLNNAIKYTPSGGTVRVTGEVVLLDKSDLPAAAPDAGYYLRCRIRDTGIGIPAAEVKKLFDRFYRASNAKQQSKRTGTGIGLDMVARLIKKHRGFIDIVSQEGDGTLVEFHLPIEKKHFHLNEIKLSGQSVMILEKPQPLPEIKVKKPDHQKARVLLVDDDPDVLEHLDAHLRPYFATYQAANGEEAWDQLFDQPVDLIISDLSMPGMDGLSLLQQVKHQDELKHIPFIILTGRNSEAQKLVCLQHGVDDFIDKPFNINLIIWRAKNLIDSRLVLRSQFGRKIKVDPTIDQDKSANELFIEQVVELIEKNIKSSLLSVEFLAEQCAMSRATFYRKMESLLDQPPSVFIRTYRLKKAAKLLQSGNYYIAEVAYQTGFSNPKYFSKCFQKEFGSTPTEYIKALTDAHSN